MENIVKIRIPSRDIFSMRRQVGADKAEGRVVELQAYRDAALVAAHTQDADTDGGGLEKAHARNMRRLHKDANEQADHTFLGQQSIGFTSRSQSGSEAFDPELGALLRFVVDRHIDGIEVDNFLKANGDEVGYGTRASPLSCAEPLIERLFLSLGVDIPSTNETMSLHANERKMV